MHSERISLQLAAGASNNQDKDKGLCGADKGLYVISNIKVRMSPFYFESN